jgi:Methyltransferase domain
MNTSATFRLSRIEAPYPWIGHIPFAVWFMRAHKPSVVVELGVHTGNSFFAICEAVALNNLDTVVHGVDTWEGDVHAGGYNEDVWLNVSGFVRDRYPKIAKLHRGFFDDKVSAFADGSIDLLHIDGLHTYEAVKHDFITWLPKLSKRGVVMFHDTEERRDDFGVFRLWGELQQKYPCLSFKHSHGLGVAFVGSDVQSFGQALSTPIETGLGNSIHLESVFEEAAFDLTNKYIHGGRALAPKQHQSKFVFGFFPVIENCSVVVAEQFSQIELSANLANHETSIPIPTLAGTVAGLTIDGFRIDPSTAEGLVCLDQLSLQSEAGATLHRFDLKHDTFKHVDTLTGMSGNSLLIACLSDDPQFYVKIPAHLLPLPAGAKLAFSVRGFPANSVAAGASSALLSSENILGSVGFFAQQQLDVQKELSTQFALQSDARKTESDAILQTSVALEKRIDQVHAQFQAQLQNLTQQLEREAEASKLAREALISERIASEQYKSELHSIKSQIDLIQGSRSWRWTRFLRG